MTKYKNKYRAETTRAKWWNYGNNAAYFIIIMTNKRNHYFGQIVEGKMNFSEIGVIANKYWIEIPKHFHIVKLGRFVVMPNHVHGIVIIDKNDVIEMKNNNIFVDTQNFAYLQPQQFEPGNKFGPQSQNMSSIVRGYKTGVTVFARKNNIDFKWQSRFYDHIIRDEESFKNISNYIENNQQNWQTDKYYN